MKYATNDQLIEMIRAQEVLNAKYNGIGWRKVVKLGWAKLALLDEVSEMATEIRPTWAWWKSDSKLDMPKATFEFIDIIHFAALMALYRYDEGSLIQASIKYQDADMGGPVGDPHNNFIKAITRFFSAVDLEHLPGIIVGLKNIIDTGAILLALNPGDVHKAYMLKNARNHKRVEGGVMEGKYDKSTEKELTL